MVLKRPLTSSEAQKPYSLQTLMHHLIFFTSQMDMDLPLVEEKSIMQPEHCFKHVRFNQKKSQVQECVLSANEANFGYGMVIHGICCLYNPI
jgi:hypothetical protein